MPGTWNDTVSKWNDTQVTWNDSGVAPSLAFPFAIHDASTVLTLGFEQAPRFSVLVADTSTVLKLGFIAGGRFGMSITDTSSVLALNVRAGVHLPLHIGGVSTVALGFHILALPLHVADSSTVVALGFRNDHATAPVPPLPPLPPFGLLVPPYTGQSQPALIRVPAWIAYKEARMEEGPWVMPPYANLYPQTPEPSVTLVPPPVRKTDLWSAMQEWPL